MALTKTRSALGRIFTQRCFYLFIVLLAMVTLLPFLNQGTNERTLASAMNAFVMIATVAAVGRTVTSFLLVLLLAAPALGFQQLYFVSDTREHLLLSWSFTAGVYAATVGYLLAYAFRRDVMTGDRLWGAAAAYLMIGVLWSLLYAIVQYFHPAAFAQAGTTKVLDLSELVYFSFTVLTSTGFGDIVPLIAQARAVCVLEQILGALFLAVLIARLAGLYPSKAAAPDG